MLLCACQLHTHQAALRLQTAALRAPGVLANEGPQRVPCSTLDFRMGPIGPRLHIAPIDFVGISEAIKDLADFTTDLHQKALERNRPQMADGCP